MYPKKPVYERAKIFVESSIYNFYFLIFKDDWGAENKKYINFILNL